MRKTDQSRPADHVMRGTAAAVSVLVISLAACGPSPARKASDVHANSAAAKTDGATFNGTMYLSTGYSQVTKAFTDKVSNVQNCAAAAKTGDIPGGFKVPSPKAPGPQADIEVAGFHGAGTYTPAMMQKDKSDSILLTGKSGTRQYDITSQLAGRTPGKEVLFLKDDGSGQFVYSGAHLDGRVADPAVAGLIQWTCAS